MHGMHCRETETGSPQCTGSPPSRKIEKFGLGWFNSPLAIRAFSNKRNRNETLGGPSELSGVRQAARCLYSAGEPSWA